MSMADDDRLRDDGQRWAEMGGGEIGFIRGGGVGERAAWMAARMAAVGNKSDAGSFPFATGLSSAVFFFLLK